MTKINIQNEASVNKGNEGGKKVKLIIAVISAVVTIVTLIFTYWDKIFS